MLLNGVLYLCIFDINAITLLFYVFVCVCVCGEGEREGGEREMGKHLFLLLRTQNWTFPPKFQDLNSSN